MSPPACVRLVVDGAVAACTSTAADFLRTAPRGAYTTARTLGGGTAVFDLQAHVVRLAASARELGASGDDGSLPPAPRDVTDPTLLAPRVHASLALALAPEVRAAWPQREFKLTMLATWGGGDGAPLSSLAVHTALLPPPPPPPVLALVAGSARAHAAAKDSAWVAGAREALDRAREVIGANEALLSTDAGHITEGSSSNFAVVDATGALCTAPDGDVLAGTVRGALLAAAREAKVPIRLTPPPARDAGTWRGALLLSTSRLALPIDAVIVRVEDGGGGDGDHHPTIAVPLPGAWRRIDLNSRSDPTTTALVAAVAAEVERRGEPV